MSALKIMGSAISQAMQANRHVEVEVAYSLCWIARSPKLQLRYHYLPSAIAHMRPSDTSLSTSLNLGLVRILRQRYLLAVFGDFNLPLEFFPENFRQYR